MSYCVLLRTDVGFGQDTEPGTSFQQSDSPPWQRRGGRDIKKDAAKPPCAERTGGLFHYRLIGGLYEPLRLRPLRRLRVFVNGRSHPAFAKAGNSLVPSTRSTLDS